MKTCHCFIPLVVLWLAIAVVHCQDITHPELPQNTATDNTTNPNPIIELPQNTSSTIPEGENPIFEPSEDASSIADMSKDQSSVIKGPEAAMLDQETFGVPIPVVGASPNSGTTYGILLAVVSETDGHIDSILAPVALYNGLTGMEIDVNLLGFPSDNLSYHLYCYHSTENFWEYNIEYHFKEFGHKNIFLDGEIEFSREATNRFFGIGPNTTEDDETSYTARNIRGHARLRWEAFPHTFFCAGIKAHRRWIRDGILDDEELEEPKPSTLDVFQNVTGIKGSYSIPLELSFVLDTRDDDGTPTSGLYLRLFFEGSPKWVMSSYSFYRMGAEMTGYIPWDKEARFVTALHGVVEYLDGDDIPFYELSMLGGQTLRGYGEGRFYDQHKVLMNIEQRVRIARFYAGEILLDLEGAVFFDVGQVMSSFKDIRMGDMQKVFGVGIRFVVRSQITAKVDIGFGEDGNAIFAGLHYPF